jgi:hypothetical protein
MLPGPAICSLFTFGVDEERGAEVQGVTVGNHLIYILLRGLKLVFWKVGAPPKKRLNLMV